MKVLMQARPDLLKIPAGDTIQVIKTKAALERLGIEIDLDLSLNPDLAEYQLIHCFNITNIDGIKTQIENARQQGCPVVLSPVYWNMEEFFKINSLDKLAWWNQGMAARKDILNKVQLILPNSKSEMCQLKMDFKFDTPFQVVPNGVDAAFYDACPDEFIQEYELKDFILCVGRVCQRKNQLTVIQALKETELQVVFIGDFFDLTYYRQCLQLGGERVKFLPRFPHEQLASAYAAAKVHILASWFDTPGLVNLEAGLAGCNLVVSNQGTAVEYFNDLVWYCSPNDSRTITSTVLEAYHSPQVDDLQSHILRNFTWQQIGEATLEAYNRLLNSKYLNRVI